MSSARHIKGSVICCWILKDKSWRFVPLILPYITVCPSKLAVYCLPLPFYLPFHTLSISLLTPYFSPFLTSQATSRSDWLQRWGRHYLQSLQRSHALQQCNNFKVINTASICYYTTSLKFSLGCRSALNFLKSY